MGFWFNLFMSFMQHKYCSEFLQINIKISWKLLTFSNFNTYPSVNHILYAHYVRVLQGNILLYFWLLRYVDWCGVIERGDATTVSLMNESLVKQHSWVTGEVKNICMYILPPHHLLSFLWNVGIEPNFKFD